MRLRRVVAVMVGAVVVLGPVVTAVGPAGAGPARRAPAGRWSVAPFIPGTTIPGASVDPTNNRVTSSNWSGYAVQAPSSFTEVQGSWTEPAVTCPAKATYSAFWVGIDGYKDATVEQTGTEADCIGGTARYSAWYEMYPKSPVTFRTTVAPGDVMNAQVTRSGKTFTLKITDSTQGWTRKVNASSAAAKSSSAEWIAEAPCCTRLGAPLPLSNFGSVAFTSAEAASGGTAEPVSAFTADNGPHEISMTKNKKVIAQPSALTAGGTSFSVTYK